MKTKIELKTPKELIESHNAMTYVALAKGGLWLSSATLCGAVIGGIYSAISTETTQVLLAVVQACQALAFICVTVLGYHGYKGHRLFHELRHWGDSPETGNANDANYQPPDPSTDTQGAQ